MNNPGFDLDIAVRGAHGSLLDVAAVVKLASPVVGYNATTTTQSASTAHFSGLMPGEYEVEVACPGYKKTTERLQLMFGHTSLPVYIYLVSESDPSSPASAAPSYVLPQNLRADLQKGIEAVNRHRYEEAKKILEKVLQKSKDNPDTLYYLGLAELGLQRSDVARDDFRRALAIDPNHELTLASLGYMQLQSGATAEAIDTLQKAVSLGSAGWRTSFNLAYAYAKANRLSDAEAEASRAAHLAREQAAGPTYLLGQIQYAEGKKQEAKQTWESLLKSFPSDPVVAQAQKALARVESDLAAKNASADASLPVSAKNAPSDTAVPVSAVAVTSPVATPEHPWAPPDIDSAAYDVATDVSCKTDTVLDAAFQHMRSQLMDFEKFTATEHVEHQDIDRYGWPGKMRARDFSYIVFVHPLGDNSLYVDESRGGSDEISGLSDSFTTTSLNAMGVNVLQPFYRDRFNYSCEGLAHLRDQAAWQIHFDQKPEAKFGIRTWSLKDKTYEIPIKGRIWISSANFAVLRVETDLREPVKDLQLTRDHLLVDYGPVNFSAGDKQLWLPWNADMYVEFRGKRYHHRHYLSSYLFFAVDTTTKVGTPEQSPQ